jgi:hypothetical protein
MNWLGGSLLLFAISERVFWSAFRADDSPTELLVTLAAYSLIALLSLSLASRFKVQNFPRVFLIGALVGWLAEAVVVQTAFGSDTNPFPFSLSFTGLSWHALISVGFGWWWLPRASRRDLIKGSLIFGALWGIWAVYAVSPEGWAGSSANTFAPHTAFTSLLLALGLYCFSSPVSALPKWEKAVIPVMSAAVGLLTLFFLLPVYPLAGGVLVCLAGVVLWRLQTSTPSSEKAQEPPFHHRIPYSPDLTRSVIVFSSGLVAVATFSVVAALAPSLPSNVALYVVTMPLGFLLLAKSLIWPTPKETPAKEPPKELGADPHHTQGTTETSTTAAPHEHAS